MFLKEQFQAINFNVIFFAVFLLGNIIIGFLAQGILHFMYDNDIAREWGFIRSGFIFLYLLMSMWFVFLRRMDCTWMSTKIISIVIALFLISSVGTLILIGMFSPLSFLGWYLYQGFIRGSWSLTFLMQMMEMTHG